MPHQTEHEFDSTLLPLALADGTVADSENLSRLDTQPYPHGESRDPGDSPDEKILGEEIDEEQEGMA